MPTASTVANEQLARRKDARRARYEAQQVVWRETNLRSGREYVDKKGVVRQSSRLAGCGRSLSTASGGVSIMLSAAGKGGFAGLQTCGSVWACPVCSEKINACRQAELHQGLTGWIGSGHSVVFGTLTMRHHKGHRLAELWDAISPAWNRTTSGSTAWKGGKRQIGDVVRFGIAGWVRVVEVKHGLNGWHPHIHFLLFLNAELTAQQLRDLELRMFGRWETALAKKGFSVVEEVGIDLRPVVSGEGLADYFSKNTYASTVGAAAYEVTGSQSKREGKGGVTPFQMLARLVATGDADDLDLWHEWEKASVGRRQLTGSRGWRELLGIGEGLTDEEIAEQEFDGSAVVTIPVEEWKASRWYFRRCDLLEHLEAGTLAELVSEETYLRWRRAATAGPPGTLAA